jgi:hypothetical protein
LDEQNCYNCIDEDGNNHKVDLTVDGTLPKKYCERGSLEGKYVQVESLHPYVEIAMRVKIIKNPNE